MGSGPRLPPSALRRPLLLQRGRRTWAAKEGEVAGAHPRGKGSNTAWGPFLLHRPEGGHEDKDLTSVSPVSPQVQVLLYYLQHPPISFAELKRNTLYFSTDV